MNIEEVRQRIMPVLRKYDVASAAVFGSVARGEARPDSDVDLLLRVGKLPFGIWGFVALKEELEKALQKKVDVLSERGLNVTLRKKITNDLIEIYERV